MERLIACCGLDCATCEARIATVQDDDVMRKAVAEKWSAMNNAPEITPETINCMGCRTNGVKFAYCTSYCQIRRCVESHGYVTCSDCPDMERCEVVGAVLGNAPEALVNLRELKR